ncbi:hypothetical protein A9F13_03g00649 [Clavispora lusitaniae]|uniref:Uncharacterized protein n=1 Tax=Clavispora lusitaniae TaxID=36911 RepID=A0AA91Q2X5_CLALS|nr:hypothetical protein A9F13_03g00649 [Clavispora lusitaniae]
MEPAPYGGFMTRTIDEEKQQQEKLKEQQVEVVVNGTTETLRPEAIHFRGVDNLSTDDIRFFIDYYLNYREEDGDYVANDKIVWFRIQWIDDSNVNAIFKTHEDAILALNALSISAGPNSVEQKSDFSQEYVSSIVQERETRPYSASIAFHRSQEEKKREQDLFGEKKKQIEEEKKQQNDMEEDDSAVVLYARQSFQSDRKVKNAGAYSRYYLLHGEPDRTRPRVPRNKRRGEYSRADDADEDLFASKLKTRGRDDEEDLFASRLRERSPTRE